MRLLRRILGRLFLIGIVVVFFLLAGRWDWLVGWAYFLTMTLGFSLQAFFIARKNPELIRRREELGKGTKKWDIVCVTLFFLTYLATLFIGAVDGGQRLWTSLEWCLWFVGTALYGLAIWLMTWSMSVNPFFEKTVRIQEDRGHYVVDVGPYTIIRHPGYLGTIFGFLLATPLLLGSWWAFVPAVISSLVVIVRTALEDRTLRLELPGYEDYARRVRYRLLPGVW
jgi:protein-S-isoprenylcysteine O-methyltransferase Ste14